MNLIAGHVAKNLPAIKAGMDVGLQADPNGRLSASPLRYLQAVNNALFHLDSQGVTLAAANVTKSALGTAKFINGFYNPATSNAYAVIHRVHVATVSGTPGGPFVYNFLNIPTVNQPITSAATGTIQNGLLTASATASLVTPLVNVVLAATGGPTTALTQLGLVGGPAAIAAGAGLYDALDEVQGGIIVPPGCIFGVMAVAVGTTHIVQSTITWEEVAITATLGNP